MIDIDSIEVVLGVNLNDNVEVKLTDYGLIILKQKYTPEEFKFLDIKDSIYKTQLWVLMSDFSSCLYVGNFNTPFSEIIFLR